MVDENDKKKGTENTPGKESVDNAGRESDPTPKKGEGKKPDTEGSSEDNGKPAENENSVNKAKTTPAKELKEATEEQRKENDRTEKLIKELREIQEEDNLAGRSHGGGTKKETEEEAWAKDAKERYAGLGMDPTPDNTPTVYS